ncbi:MULTISPECIES: hypothetical protein [Bacillaceae]|uniref:Uncharacterized protein n=1 Tax=Gracilibacillus salinarum TaxID=2932255 RepID=A0ABY4GK95_9BACI|nr:MULTISPECIES: hypothetical protein [Bacillaceae]UOQ84646.1 hypothetical protein MUN87_18605 [Gracilibacillus salinarum]
MEWIQENINWIFSGIGVSAILGIIGLFTKNHKGKEQMINSGNNSTNIQSGKDVNITLGGKNDGQEK